MERRDSTWMIVGVGVGCLFVLVLVMCGLGGLFFVVGRSSTEPPPYQPPPYQPPGTTAGPLPPPTLVPPVPTPVEPADPLAPPGTAPDDRAPRLVHATVQEVTGTTSVHTGDLCEFHVERRDRDDGTFWCNAQIVCGGQLLYGGAEAGYFPCTLFSSPSRGVVGSDPNTTPVDRDGAMSIDSVQGRLEIWDDAHDDVAAYRVVAHIDAIE